MLAASPANTAGNCPTCALLLVAALPIRDVAKPTGITVRVCAGHRVYPIVVTPGTTKAWVTPRPAATPRQLVIPGRLCGRRRPRPTAGAARPPSRVRRSAQLPADPLRRRPQRAWACRGPGVPGGSAGRAGVAAGRCRRRACRGSAHGAAADGTDRGCSECGGPPSNWPVASGAGRCSRSLGSRGGRRGCRVGLRRPIRLSAGPVWGAAVDDPTNAGRASVRPQLAGGRHGTTRVAVTAANLLGRLPGHAPAAEMVRSQHSSSSTLCPRSRSRQPRARQGHQRGATGAATDGTSIGGARDVARGAVAYLGAVIVTEAP